MRCQPPTAELPWVSIVQLCYTSRRSLGFWYVTIEASSSEGFAWGNQVFGFLTLAKMDLTEKALPLRTVPGCGWHAFPELVIDDTGSGAPALSMLLLRKVILGRHCLDPSWEC